MLVYPFIPEERRIYQLDGFDRNGKDTSAPLLVLPANENCPDWYHGIVFSPENGLYNSLNGSQLICITSQVCGGSFSVYLKSMLHEYGDGLWLFFDPLCHVFSLPAGSQPGKRLSQQALQEILQSAPSHFSSVLCCKYCMLAQEAKIVLFDTPETMAEKRRIAEAMGIGHGFGWLQI